VSIEFTVVVFPLTDKLPAMTTLEFNVRFGLNRPPVSVPDAIF
jgi:hypothetical protein